MQGIKNYLAGTGQAIFFGLSFLAAKQALNLFSQPVMLALRFTLSAAALWLLVWLKILPIALRNKPWKKLILLSLIYPVLSFSLEAKGVSMIASSQAGAIMSLSPVFPIILGILFLREKATLFQISMVFLAAVGVILISLGNSSQNSGNIQGICIMLCCAFLDAVQITAVHRLSGEFSSLEITCVMNGTAAVCFDLYSIILFRNNLQEEFLIPLASGKGILSIIYLGLGCSVGAFFCLNYINSHLDVVRAAVFINLSTIISVVAGVLLGGDRLTAAQVIGIIMILAGVWGVNAPQKPTHTH